MPPKIPKTMPKWIEPFFEHAAQHERKRALREICMTAPAIFEKHWDGFYGEAAAEREQNPPKKRKANPAKTAENAVNKVAESFGQIEDPEQAEQITSALVENLPQEVKIAIAQSLSPNQIASGSSATVNNAVFEEEKQQVMTCVQNLISEVGKIQTDFATINEESADAATLLSTTKEVFNIVGTGLDKIASALERTGNTSAEEHETEDDDNHDADGNDGNDDVHGSPHASGAEEDGNDGPEEADDGSNAAELAIPPLE